MTKIWCLSKIDYYCYTGAYPGGVGANFLLWLKLLFFHSFHLSNNKVPRDAFSLSILIPFLQKSLSFGRSAAKPPPSFEPPFGSLRSPQAPLTSKSWIHPCYNQPADRNRSYGLSIDSLTIFVCFLVAEILSSDKKMSSYLREKWDYRLLWSICWIESRPSSVTN